MKELKRLLLISTLAVVACATTPESRADEEARRRAALESLRSMPLPVTIREG